MLTKEEKEKITKKEKNTGGTVTQIKLLTEKINKIIDHLKKSPKDIHSNRGFLIMLSKRKKLLKYLQRKNEKAYQEVLKKLKLKK
ncbi:MAG: 30S ribosomal protein S15 [Patescibacteria group bacterium]|nr:30S ribosomal protein S15 [Patescibacteria group bacterium]